MLVNDRSVSVLENYDFEVIRTQKSRNAILCETNKGWYILKEYKGPVFRLEMMAKVLEGVRQNGFTRAEQLLSTKEGALFCCDQEQNRCIVKSWPQGRECSLKDGQECRDAMRTLAVLHSALHFPQLQQEYGLHAVSLAEEYEKRNRELRKVRRFLREKGQKTTFEINLQQTFDLFLEEAERVRTSVPMGLFWMRGNARKAEAFVTGIISITICSVRIRRPSSILKNVPWTVRCGICIFSCVSY